MIRINYSQQALQLVVFLLLQIPFIHRLILFDTAFGFFYIGFLLFLPYGMNRSLAMTIAFFTGLLIDVFSNTPGMHASACIVLVFVRDYWFDAVMRRNDDDIFLDWNELRLWGSFKFLFPLILLHHTTIFLLENGGFDLFVSLLAKIVYSSIYSFIIILGVSFLAAPKQRRT